MLGATDLNGLVHHDVHKAINSNDDSFDLSASINLKTQLLSHVLDEIRRIALLWLVFLNSRH